MSYSKYLQKFYNLKQYYQRENTMELIVLHDTTIGALVFGLVVGAVLYWYVRRSRQLPLIQLEPDLRPQALSDEECVKFFSRKLKSETEEREDCYDLTKINYLRLLDNIVLKGIAEACVRKYGTLDCGERGPPDHHLLELRLADFMGVDEAVVYSYGFATITSAIIAYCKKDDYIFVDEQIGAWAKQGVITSKSHVFYFKHNNALDLENKIKQVHIKEQKPKGIVKKFVIVEALYSESGTICNLPPLVVICKQQRAKLFIDESKSFAILGATGRGITEYYNINTNCVDLIMISAEGSLGLYGGFCLGSSYVIEHQRLMGFAGTPCVLPPFMCRITFGALDMFNKDPTMFNALRGLSVFAHRKLATMPEWELVSDPVSPMKVIRLKTPNAKKLTHIHKFCEDNKVIIIRDEEKLRMHLHLNLNDRDVEHIVDVISRGSRS